MKRMKNPQREAEKKMKDTILRIEAALDKGLSTRTDIAKAAGIKISQLAQIFNKNRELYAKYCVVRKTIVDLASDNIMDIVADKEHPKNYDASKWVVTNYKSDLDSTLESKDGEGLDIEVEGGSKKRPVVIRFGKKNKE